jgi:PAS domain S-box-containing protein
MQDIIKSYNSMTIQNAIIENCEDIVTVKDLDLKYTACNKAFLKMLGVQDETLTLNKSIDEVLTVKNANIIKEKSKQVIKRLKTVSFILNIEKEYYFKIVKVTSFPVIQDNVLTGILSITRDITNEEILRLKLIEKIGIINTLLENIPMLAYLKDTNNNYITGSKYAKKFVEEGFDPYAGNIQIDMKNEDENIVSEDKYVIKNKKSLTGEKAINSVDGRKHNYKISKTPILDITGEVTGIVTLAQNTDVEKQLELQKELFIATLTHDLKNPLLAQISSLELLSKGSFGELNETQKSIIDMIIESSYFMKEMLYSVLSTYKYENGMIKLEKKTFDIKNLINLCINETLNFAHGKNIEFECTFKAENYNVFADENQIRRVIVNLLNNAVNYAFNNTKIKIDFSENNENLILKIANESPIIPENMRKRIFDKYISGNNFVKGIGLGLYFCKKVVEAHNGDIKLNSTGTNNEFEIILPKREDKKTCDALKLV